MKFSRQFLTLGLTLAAAPALAQNAAPAAGGGQALLVQLPIILGIFAFLYFAVLQPQKKQQAKHTEFLGKLAKGEEVVTASGIIGTIRGLTDKIVSIEISPGTEIKVLRSQIAGYLNESKA